MMRALAARESKWGGISKLQVWEKGKGVRFPRSEKDHPFRIPLALCLSGGKGDILPLQQCMETRFEPADRLDSTQWHRDPSELVGMWEITPVSSLLDTAKFDASGRGWMPVAGPLRRFTSLHAAAGTGPAVGMHSRLRLSWAGLGRAGLQDLNYNIRA